MKHKSNRNIVFSCSYHVVFCPKYRRPVLVNGVDERFKEIAWEVADELGFEIAEMEVMPDHVHLLLSIDPQLSIHRAIKRIKGRSSHDLRERCTSHGRHEVAVRPERRYTALEPRELLAQVVA